MDWGRQCGLVDGFADQSLGQWETESRWRSLVAGDADRESEPGGIVGFRSRAAGIPETVPGVVSVNAMKVVRRAPA